MNILVHSKSVPVTDAIREFVRKKLISVTKFSKTITHIDVFLDDVKSRKGLIEQAQVMIKIGVPGKDILCRAKNPDLYKAICLAVEDSARWLRKKKEKYLSHKKQSKRSAPTLVK